MEKLSFQDSTFLRLESAQRPFHVAGLMILKTPEGASPGYMRKLAKHCGRLNELWPIFNRQLKDPNDIKAAAWVEAKDYEAERHVLHYSLPQPGRMDELIRLVSLAHEQMLDRSRPLWQLHLIEGLPGNRFALYCKVHHALIDGVGALRMVNALFNTDPDAGIDFRRAKPIAQEHHKRNTMLRQMTRASRGLIEQTKAMPQLYTLLRHMGEDAVRGRKDRMKLPFTSPRTLFNTEVDANRKVIVLDLPMGPVRKMAKQHGGTINDVLLAICGGALRSYLMEHNAAPIQSLIAGMPVSVKTAEQESGNQLAFMLCPYYTDERDPRKRLQRVVEVTKGAKAEFSHLSKTASMDYANMLMLPTLLLTLTGNATLTRPGMNAIFSNVPGSREKLYLEGAELESMYPFSVVTDGMGINLTVVSYTNKLCFAVTSCPTEQPGIEEFGKHLKESYRSLRDAVAG